MNDATLVIINPTSGRGRAGRFWRWLGPALAERVPGLVVHQTAGPGDAERRAAEWADSGETGAIVVVGGDGTLHEAVNGLGGSASRLLLGVIPAGTGNDFARNAGIPLDPVAALARLATGPARLLDLGRLRFREPAGRVRSVVFLNSASVGVSPAANRHAQALRRVLPGRLRYIAGGIVALLTEPRRRFIVIEEGHQLYEGKALNITIANGPGFGGGMRIAPEACLGDGALERVIIGQVGLGRSLVALARLRRGGHVRMREVSVTRTAGTTVIESTGAPLHVEADGHDFVAEGRLSVSVEAGALRLLGSGIRGQGSGVGL